MLTFVTPCYRNDIDRLKLLRESIIRFCGVSSKHYILVPRADINLFKREITGSESASVTLLCQNDYISSLFYPSCLYQAVNYMWPTQTWRLSRFSGRSGWIHQQIIKLSLPVYSSAVKNVVVDSDVIFIRPFNDIDFSVKTNKRVLIKRFPKSEDGMHRSHVETARKILKLPPGPTNHNYMSSPAILYTDWIVSLQDYLEKIYMIPWQKALFKFKTFSEYILYGVFVDEILNPQNVKRIAEPLHYGVWKTEDLDPCITLIKKPDGLSKQGKLPVCLVIQSNIGMSVDEYKSVIKQNIF